MKLITKLCIVFLITQHVVAGELSKEDADTIQRDVEMMMTQFNEGDASLILERTHESIYSISGGKDNFEKIFRKISENFKKEGMIQLELISKPPTQTYQSSEETVCFCPLETTMAIEGEKIKAIAFMVAIRTKGEGEWKYLGGAGFSKDPKMLYQLFPDLEKGIKLPPYKFEKI